MKKWMLTLLVICMLGTMVGCGGGNDETKGAGDGEQVTEEAKEISRGTVDGDVYTSEFIGLSFTKPELWVYATDEEIAATMQMGLDVLNSDDFAAEAAKLTSIYDMLATDLMTGNNVSVSFENLKMSNSSNVTEEQYIAVVKQMMSDQAATMNYEFGETVERKLGSRDFYVIPAEGSYMGIPFEQYMYLHKEGVYMAIITVSIFDGSDIATYEAMFK